ncbi:hypothetical protein B0J13DRAFT_608069 [Dactylonectria estremocensis]|uniref:Uncharacterized protein n=1 Tax=Dactylonectria estremocensis TaxID=1079267 RepID=A0A9P9J409_9HYPO|nr:hypothetical protein B0J13DRAFT_608069 [Dactylonectria estremocensis]
MAVQESPPLNRNEPPLSLPDSERPTPPERPFVSDIRRFGTSEQMSLFGSFQIAAVQPVASAFPSIPDDINGFIAESGIDSSPTDIVHPYVGTFPVPSAKMPEENEFSPLDLSNSVALKQKLTRQLTEGEEELIDECEEFLMAQDTTVNDYKITVQQQLTAPRDPYNLDPKPEDVGYLDEHGYVVEWVKVKDKAGQDVLAADARGEATYFTAIAVVALASGNYLQDSWEAQNANLHISRFLDVLENKSWGNKDDKGDVHPIRHPEWVEYYGDDHIRRRPMSKDSFGQIVLACYCAYKCANSSAQVREQAHSLLNKWIIYLSRHQWLIHSNYVPDEFQTDGDEFVNLFDDEEHQHRITKIGKESFMLYPHELWALRNCAIEIGVPHEIILPNWAFSTGLNASFFDGPLEELVKQSGGAIDYLYDRLQYRKKWSLDLVPGWKKSRISGTLSIGAFGVVSKQQIRQLFETALRDYVLSAFEFRKELPNVLDSIMRPLSQFLYAPEINQILCKASYKESNSKYAIWPFIMEIESRPYLRLLLEPCFRDFFGFLAKKDNPNGTWAWLAHRHDVVLEQIAGFENAGDVQKWRGYAYGEKACNDWIKKTSEQELDHFCSRLDYLVLKNLAEKGLPQMPILEASFKPFLDFAVGVLDRLLQKITDNLTQQLKYFRRWVDDLGNVIEDTFSADKVTQAIKKTTGEIVTVAFRADGVVEISRWTATGSFKSFQRLEQVAENGLARVDNLLEFQKRFIDGTLKSWKWEHGKVLQSFGKYLGVPESGLTTTAVKVISLARNPAGELTQMIRSADGVLQNFTHWAAGEANGFAKATQRLTQKHRTSTGELLRWTYHPGGALKEFSQWSKSTGELSAEAADHVKRALREIEGKIDTFEWTRGVFDRSMTYAASLPSGIAKVSDCILLQNRDVGGILEQWELKKGAVKAYSRWQHSTEEGAAQAVDAVVRIERQGEKIVKHVFKEGIALQSQVLDAVGNVIGSVTKRKALLWVTLAYNPACKDLIILVSLCAASKKLKPSSAIEWMAGTSASRDMGMGAAVVVVTAVLYVVKRYVRPYWIKTLSQTSLRMNFRPRYFRSCSLPLLIWSTQSTSAPSDEAGFLTNCSDQPRNRQKL